MFTIKFRKVQELFRNREVRTQFVRNDYETDRKMDKETNGQTPGIEFGAF